MNEDSDQVLQERRKYLRKSNNFPEVTEGDNPFQYATSSKEMLEVESSQTFKETNSSQILDDKTLVKECRNFHSLTTNESNEIQVKKSDNSYEGIEHELLSGKSSSRTLTAPGKLYLVKHGEYCRIIKTGSSKPKLTRDASQDSVQKDKVGTSKAKIIHKASRDRVKKRKNALSNKINDDVDSQHTEQSEENIFNNKGELNADNRARHEEIDKEMGTDVIEEASDNHSATEDEVVEEDATDLDSTESQLEESNSKIYVHAVEEEADEVDDMNEETDDVDDMNEEADEEDYNNIVRNEDQASLQTRRDQKDELGDNVHVNQHEHDDISADADLKPVGEMLNSDDKQHCRPSQVTLKEKYKKYPEYILKVSENVHPPVKTCGKTTHTDLQETACIEVRSVINQWIQDYKCGRFKQYGSIKSVDKAAAQLPSRQETQIVCDTTESYSKYELMKVKGKILEESLLKQEKYGDSKGYSTTKNQKRSGFYELDHDSQQTTTDRIRDSFLYGSQSTLNDCICDFQHTTATSLDSITHTSGSSHRYQMNQGSDCAAQKTLQQSSNGKHLRPTTHVCSSSGARKPVQTSLNRYHGLPPHRCTNALGVTEHTKSSCMSQHSDQEKSNQLLKHSSINTAILNCTNERMKETCEEAQQRLVRCLSTCQLHECEEDISSITQKRRTPRICNNYSKRKHEPSDYQVSLQDEWAHVCNFFKYQQEKHVAVHLSNLQSQDETSKTWNASHYLDNDQDIEIKSDLSRQMHSEISTPASYHESGQYIKSLKNRVRKNAESRVPDENLDSKKTRFYQTPVNSNESHKIVSKVSSNSIILEENEAVSKNKTHDQSKDLKNDSIIVLDFKIGSDPGVDGRFSQFVPEKQFKIAELPNFVKLANYSDEHVDVSDGIVSERDSDIEAKKVRNSLLLIHKDLAIPKAPFSKRFLSPNFFPRKKIDQGNNDRSTRETRKFNRINERLRYNREIDERICDEQLVNAARPHNNFLKNKEKDNTRDSEFKRVSESGTDLITCNQMTDEGNKPLDKPSVLDNIKFKHGLLCSKPYRSSQDKRQLNDKKTYLTSHMEYEISLKSRPTGFPLERCYNEKEAVLTTREPSTRLDAKTRQHNNHGEIKIRLEHNSNPEIVVFERISEENKKEEQAKGNPKIFSNLKSGQKYNESQKPHNVLENNANHIKIDRLEVNNQFSTTIKFPQQSNKEQPTAKPNKANPNQTSEHIKSEQSRETYKHRFRSIDEQHAQNATENAQTIHEQNNQWPECGQNFEQINRMSNQSLGQSKRGHTAENPIKHNQTPTKADTRKSDPNKQLGRPFLHV